MSEPYIDHDEWNYSPKKLPKAPKIELGNIRGVLPFDGARNPGIRSSVAHRVWLTYCTAANGWMPKVGICESAAEEACSYEALMSSEAYDVRFQPLTVGYRDEDGKFHEYTHDLLVTKTNGHRRLIFVRNELSLSKPRTWRNIASIATETPPGFADDMVVASAGNYSRQRRENLFRMHQFGFVAQRRRGIHLVNPA